MVHLLRAMYDHGAGVPVPETPQTFRDCFEFVGQEAPARGATYFPPIQKRERISAPPFTRRT